MTLSQVHVDACRLDDKSMPKSHNGFATRMRLSCEKGGALGSLPVKQAYRRVSLCSSRADFVAVVMSDTKWTGGLSLQ